MSLAFSAESSPRNALLLDARRSGDFLVVLGAPNREMGERMKAAAERLRLRRRGGITFLEATDATEADYARPLVILVGTIRSNPWIARVASVLPLSVSSNGIQLRETLYAEPRDSLQLVYPSPFPKGKLVYLFTGNSDEAVLDALSAERRGDFQIRRAEVPLVFGRFGNDWSLDPAEIRELAFTESPSEDFVRRVDTARERVSALFDPPPPLPEIRFYPSLEHKGLVTNNTRPAHFDGVRLHAVSATGAEPERLLVERWLEPKIPDPTLRFGLSTLLVSNEPELFDRTSAGLSLLSARPALATLPDESPFVLEAMSASFARYVLDKRGPRSLELSLADLAPFESDWIESLDVEDSPRPPAPSSFLRGFTLAHEGFEIHDGYLSARCERSLDKLQSLGVDSVAVVPYAFVNNPSRIERLAVPERPGSETDEAVTHAIRAAKSKGMTVLLKPQIWLRGSWPGEIDPSNSEDEERFFLEYGRWMRHYALMAERNGVELFSIGTELSKMTDPSQTPHWEALIRDVRTLYKGRLVYAANWGEEVERVGFWPLLDFIGVDFYYPLSSDDSPSGDALRAGFELALEPLRALSLRLGKPVLLTEIGYASTASPWKNPHASDRSTDVSLEDQKRAYEAAFHALVDETSWVRGMFWWKWPTDLALGGPDDSGFTPNGKPAEEVIRRGYDTRIQ